MNTLKSIFIFVAILLLPIVFAACAGGGPQERSFTLEFQDGSSVEKPPTFEVKQGDTVTIKLQSDIEATFHLHGYDVENEVSPNQISEMIFVADATGRFPIEVEETEVDVAFLEVQPR